MRETTMDLTSIKNVFADVNTVIDELKLLHNEYISADRSAYSPSGDSVVLNGVHIPMRGIFIIPLIAEFQKMLSAKTVGLDFSRDLIRSHIPTLHYVLSLLASIIVTADMADFRLMSLLRTKAKFLQIHVNRLIYTYGSTSL